MKTRVALGVSIFIVVLSLSSFGQSENAPAKQSPRDLTGAWDGANQPSRNDDWGEVNLKATPAGYIGTYSDTFNRQLGSVTFRSTDGGRLEGLWWESDLKRYGSWVLEVSEDGRTIRVDWKALSEGGVKAGKSVLKRK